MDHYLIQNLALALGLGLLVGLQREKVRDPIAGIRTFACITLFGALCGLLSQEIGPWLVGVGLLAVASLLVAGYVGYLRVLPMPSSEENEPKGRRKAENAAVGPPSSEIGLTTEIAALLMFAVGAYVMIGDSAIASIIGGAVFVLLHLKEPIHTFVGKLEKTDLHAIVQFVLIALIILPVLPDEGYGPWGVLNPHHIWLMVVLIVAISLGGYIAFKLLGGKVGALLSGVLGGMISSTATTVSYARRSVGNGGSVQIIVGILLLATTVSQVRVLVEIGVVAPYYWWDMSLPLIIFLVVNAAISLFLVLRVKNSEETLPEPKNPAELKAALIFGALYGAVTLGIEAAERWLGESGMYAVAVLSGLHDMDAITLTTSRMVSLEEIGSSLGWRLILIATLSNMVMKTAYAYLLGSHPLGLRLAAWNGVLIGVGIVLLLVMAW